MLLIRIDSIDRGSVNLSINYQLCNTQTERQTENMIIEQTELERISNYKRNFLDCEVAII